MKLLKFVLFVLPFSVMWAQTLTPQDELIAIDKELKILNERLHKLNIEEMKEDVRSQNYMIGDWSTYGKEVEQIHRLEELDDQLEIRIKELEQRRAKILNEQNAIIKK